MRFAEMPARAPWLVILLALIATLAAAEGALRIQAEVDFVDTVPPHAGLEPYRDLLEQLDGTRFSVIYMAHDPASATASLRTDDGFDSLVVEQENLTRFLTASFPAGSFTHTLSVYEAMRQGNYMFAKVATAGNAPDSAYELPSDPFTYDQVRGQVRDGGNVDDVLALDGSSALVLVFFATKDSSEARALAGELDDAVAVWRQLAPEAHPTTTAHATSGLHFASHYTDEINRSEMARWAPVSAAGVLVALTLVLRRPANALIAVASLAVALTWTYGAMGLSGIRISFLTVFLAPIVVGTGVDHAIHVLHRYEEERASSADRTEAVSAALRATRGPVALAALTTAAGLLVLLLVPAPLFAQIGGVGALGIVFGFIAAVTVAPALRALLPELSSRKPPALRSQWLSGWANQARARPWVPTLLIAILLGAALIVATGGTRFESGSAENEFPQDDPVIVLQHRIESEYGTYQRAYLVVQGDLIEPAALRALFEATRTASDTPLFRTSSSVTDLLIADDRTDEGAADILRNGLLTPANAAPSDVDRLPATREEAKARLDRLFADPLWRAIAPFTISRDYTLAVVAVQIDPWSDQTELAAVKDSLEWQASKVQDTLGPTYRVAAAGSPVNRAAIVERTPYDVGLATLGAAAAVTGVLGVAWARRGMEGLRMAAVGGGVVLGSALMLLATVPLLDAWYAYAHGSLGAAANTAALNNMFLLAFAVTVAVGVDDIVHLTHRHWEGRDAGLPAFDAMRRAFDRTGRAITGTTVTTFVAFALLSGAYFLQSKNLAILTAAGVVYAYVLTLLVAPLTLGRGRS